ncbi:MULTISPECIES: transposase [Streptomyces]|uniref:Transposase n=1 Tax=Streptomyces kaempferi TaxID=333725 RepID=A0ABW3XEN0_9ACTN
MNTPHPAALRTRALQLLSEGQAAGEVARQLGIPPTTVYRWRRSRTTPSSLTRARTRIQELEEEVLLCRKTIDTMSEVMPPKDVTR